MTIIIKINRRVYIKTVQNQLHHKHNYRMNKINRKKPSDSLPQSIRWITSPILLLAPNALSKEREKSQTIQAQLTRTLPCHSSASFSKTLNEKSRSEALQPVQRSTTSTSRLTFFFPGVTSRVTQILRPQSGLVFGFGPTWAASKIMCETATMLSDEVEDMPQAPSPGW